MTTPQIPILSSHDATGVFKSNGGGPFKKSEVRAVDGVSLTVHERETLSVVGESGSGKSTLSRMFLRLMQPSSGTIEFRGNDLWKLSRTQLEEYRKQVQVVFQDPGSSLNPRKTVGRSIGEVMRFHGKTTKEREERDVAEVLDSVGLPSFYLHRMPHELSGGQKQRVAIGRAISVKPKLIVADEALSALDVSIQAQVLELMKELREELDIAYLFISHDLGVVREISDRVAVMYRGKVVELGTVDQVIGHPSHKYTQGLLDARLIADPRQARLQRANL